MTPDGPKDATVALEYQMWGDEGVPFLEEEDDDEEVESGKEEEIDTKKLQLNCVGWKLRSGLGKFNVKHAWEPRRFVLDGNKLSYYEIANNGIDDDVIVGGSDQKVNTTEEEEAAGVECIEQEQQPSPKRGCGAILNEDSKEKSKSKAENIKGQDEGIDDDDKNATADAANDITIKTESPRGTIELSQEKEASIEPSEENASSSSNPLSASAISSSVKSTVIPSPTPYVLKISLPEDHISWRFCFHDRKTQMTWCNALRKITGTEEDENKQIHNFEPGDHVVRWEMIMLPVLVWPIQIHGIVLEAGRNCVIIADFGLTSYGPGDGGAENEDGNNSKSDRQRKKKTNEEKKDDDESSKQKEKEHHDFSMEAWKKLRPKEKRRLNVIVLTDIHEIKKWTKVNYGRNFFKKKDGKKKMMSSISSWFGKKSSTASKNIFRSDGGGPSSPLAKQVNLVEKEKNTDDIAVTASVSFNNEGRDERNLTNAELSHHIPIPKDEPEWFRGADDVGSDGEDMNTVREGDGDLGGENDDNEGKPPPVFSIAHVSRDHDTALSLSPKRENHRSWHAKSRKSKNSEDANESSSANKLPKSDPAKIVLARTNFVLEYGDELLPPYHVFHSNSECIAVWCKTGRWSTLQTSVFLHSCSVGNAKSSVAFTLGVAATHVLLAPVVALGGVAAVTAPWIILKKSKGKWEAATMKLTEEFWMRAEPEVFVEAIEHWSGIH